MIRNMAVLPAGMLESHHVTVKSGSRLAARYGDSIRRYARITAVSVKCDYWHTTSRHARIKTTFGQIWIKTGRGMGMRRYARITAVSVKSGSKLAGKYWHTTSRNARITAVLVKSGSRPARKYWHTNSGYARITAVTVTSGWEVLAYYQQVC